MKIETCTDQTEWNHTLISQGCAEFLQSWEWGEIQDRSGIGVARWLFSREQQIFPVQAFLYPLFAGYQLCYVPRTRYADIFTDPAITSFLKKKKILFVRIEPSTKASLPEGAKKVSCRQPQQTLLVSLDQSDDDLLAQMHAKTRYNIRLAERKGVTVSTKKNSEWFWRLNEETTARDDFQSHHKKYYEGMLTSESVFQYTALVSHRPIASIICVHWGGRMTYLHGASSNEERQLMAPYLLQWTAMQDAKKRGDHLYDVWGVAPIPKRGEAATTFHGYEWSAAHAWTGITRFKAGFGGTPTSYPDAGELPLFPFLYTMFSFIKKIRRHL